MCATRRCKWMTNTMPDRAANNMAGICAAIAIAAIFILALAPLSGALLAGVLLVAAVALGLCIRALLRRDRHGGSGGDGSHPGNDDGASPYFASQAFIDSASSSADDGLRGCRFDSADTPSGASDSGGGSGGDCGGGSSDSSSSSSSSSSGD